jgi:hypothetical protein
MILSVAFIITDCLSVTSVIQHALPDGLNPFWKMAYIFKCFTDTIILDDFKTVLDKLKEYKLGQLSTGAISTGPNGSGSGSSDIDPPFLQQRRPTAYAPWNESRGITGDDRNLEKRSTMREPIIPEVDLENQLQYWSGFDEANSTASNSTATKATKGT